MGISGIPVTEQTKKNIKWALEETGGLVVPAAKLANVTHTTIYNLNRSDPECKNMIEEARKKRMERIVNKAEIKIEEKIEAGDTTSIIYSLRTQGRSRGWEQKDKQEIDQIIVSVTDYANAKTIEEDDCEKPSDEITVNVSR